MIIRNLSTLSFAQGFTLWHYSHDGDLADIWSPEFFSPAIASVVTGDHILVSARNGASHVYIKEASQETKSVQIAKLS